MFERFTGDLRSTVKLAQDIAVEEGAKSVEARHLLLALARQPTPPMTFTLERLGLTEAAINEAAHRELVSALH